MTLKSYVEHKKYIKHGPSNYEVWKSVILEYNQYSYPDDLDMVIKSIQDNLDIKFCPAKFREINMGSSLIGTERNQYFGHCYHAMQALFYFFKDAGLKAMSAKCVGPAGHHWWLQDGDKIIDPTAEQYDAFDFDPPYQNGKETAWMGWKNRPHRKTQDLMLLVQPSAKLYSEVYRDKPKKEY